MNVITLSLFVLFFSAGCSGTGCPRVGCIESDTLKEALKGVLSEYSERANPEMKNTDLLLESFTKNMPTILSVSCAEEKRYSNGEFMNESNKIKFRLLRDRLDTMEVGLSIFGKFLVQKYDEGMLEGARLELGVRVLDYYMETIRREDSKGEDGG